jgi:hypothetical protein
LLIDSINFFIIENYIITASPAASIAAFAVAVNL